MPKVAYVSGKVARTCQQCGTSFESYPSQPRKFCSRECMGKFNAGREMPLKPRTGRYKPCERCGTEFWAIKSEDERRRFCSTACHDAHQRRLRVVKTCPVCSKEFELKPSQAAWRGKGQTYCSRECMGAGQTKRALDRMHNGKPAVVDTQGYVRVFEPDHPSAYKGGWIAEHRLVVEEALGRRLQTGEHVHHINHTRTDNRPENLTVLTHAEHSQITGRENGEALKAALEARQKLAEYERRFGPLNI